MTANTESTARQEINEGKKKRKRKKTTSVHFFFPLVFPLDIFSSTSLSALHPPERQTSRTARRARGLAGRGGRAVGKLSCCFFFFMRTISF